MKQETYSKSPKLFFTMFIVAGLIVTLILPLSSSETITFGTYQKGSQVRLKQICDNCSYVNITELLYPNSSLALNDTSMNKVGTDYNYEFNNTESVGKYYVTTCGDLNGITSCQTYDFEVTPLGTTMTTQKSIIYVIVFIISILILVGLLIIGIALPVSNKRDEMTGYILAVSNLKYFKLVCLAFAYLDVVFISYFSWGISSAYLDMSFITEIFHFTSIFLTVCILPLFILFVYLSIANLIRDSQVADFLSRGLSVK
jgi:hypothetical protein